MHRKRPRLDAALYVGLQRCFLTFCTDQRQRFFTENTVVDLVLEKILHAATESDVAILAYCYMPDHVHLLVEGETEAADLLEFVHQGKQRSAYAFAQREDKRLWQPSFYDHLLRDDEGAISVARYIVENPVRAGLVESPREYAFLGSSKYAMDAILDAVCWRPTGQP